MRIGGATEVLVRLGVTGEVKHTSHRRLTSRLAVFLLAAGLLLTLSGCNGSDYDTKPHRSQEQRQIALVLKSQTSDFWKTVRTGAEAAAKEFNVELFVEAASGEEDVQEQLQLVEQAVHYKRDAIVLAANDGMALAAPVNRAAAAGIPVISIDTELHEAKTAAFIGIDHYDAGRKAGEKLAALLGGAGRVAIVSFRPELRHTAERERGVLEALQRHPGIRVIAKAHCTSSETLCVEQARELLEDDEPVNGIAALHAVSSLGVARELERLGLQGQVQVVTFDSTQEDIEYLQEGVIQATVVQNPFTMGYLGVKYAVDALQGAKLPERYDTGTTVIDQHNMFWTDNQKRLFPFVK
ncbi:substrate-binding domain-containing protein [Paenibacillus sp. YYML68]|uniref:substrate-binding domain-containing protein n=1 Tax=Paenibacillus sp. YYML68 TaxID=2909250 RepID=UPI00249126DB|nr:substrate-binding domain-containing protein [Paenibacillus sp. YYML68]